MTTSKETTLKNHLSLCDDVYACMVEENKLLKQKESNVPDDSFLTRKRDLLNRLEESTTALKGINQEGAKLNDASKHLVQQSLNRMMKIFFLDRENEQLLLKANLKNNLPEPAKPVTTTRLKKIYQEHASPVPKTEDVLSPNAPSALFNPNP